MAKEPENEDDFSELDLSEEHDALEDILEEDDDDDLLSDIDDDLSTEDKTTKSSTPLSTEPKGMISPEEIPVTLVVEIGQVAMTMDQLLKLQPGNLLDVNLNPEDGVNLTINGKVVGKGELFRIGDVIGVRILQLGHQ